MTVGDCAQSLLAVAAILSGPRFDAACAILENVLVGPKGYAQPTTWSLQGVDTMQGMPAMPGAENLLVSEREHIDVHIAHAITLSSPLASDVRRARTDLIAAVEYVVGLRYPEQIAAARTATSRALDVAEALLAPEDAALRALTSPAAARLLQDRGPFSRLDIPKKGNWSLAVMIFGSVVTAHQLRLILQPEHGGL